VIGAQAASPNIAVSAMAAFIMVPGTRVTNFTPQVG
jgi:hypothetical protein